MSDRILAALQGRVPALEQVGDQLVEWEIVLIADELAPMLARLLDERLQDRVNRAGSSAFDPPADS